MLEGDRYYREKEKAGKGKEGRLGMLRVVRVGLIEKGRFKYA